MELKEILDPIFCDEDPTELPADKMEQLSISRSLARLAKQRADRREIRREKSKEARSLYLARERKEYQQLRQGGDNMDGEPWDMAIHNESKMNIELSRKWAKMDFGRTSIEIQRIEWAILGIVVVVALIVMAEW